MKLWFWSLATLIIICTVVPSFGQSSAECQQKAVLKDLYRGLHSAITEQSTCGSPGGDDREYVSLLAVGIPLEYSKFNPGKPNRYSQPGTLPQFVIENGLPYVDKVFPTGASRSGVKSKPQTVVSDSQKDNNLLSAQYDFVLSHMMISPRNFSNQDILRAKYYLQELVPNPEHILINRSRLPRYLLYDYYRSQYFDEKARKDRAIAEKRSNLLSQESFENWGQKVLPELQSDTESAFNKWQIFGYKSEVEKQMQYFDIDVYEDQLTSARALFKSMERPSERNPHDVVHPFKLKPEKWFNVLRINIPESSDELRYLKSILRAKLALLNATRIDLSDDTNEEVKHTQELIRKNLKELSHLIQNAVDKLLQMEVECFSHANISVCGDIISGHTAFRFLLQNVSKQFSQQEYLESVLDNRDQSIIVLDQKLRETEAKIESLNQLIIAAEKKEIGATIDESTDQNTVITSCPEAGKVHFTFHSQTADISSECARDNDSPIAQDYCVDDRIPDNATTQQLWNLRSCSVDSELKSFQLYDNFTTLMNSAPAKLSATLLKVDIHRSWLNLAIFEDSGHFTMKHGRGVVSPGPLKPISYFKQVIESGKYLMPQYTSSFVLATNVSVFFPGLGAWNDTDDDDNVNGIVHILMKYAYSPNLAGGFGPFTFVPPDGVSIKHNFRVERKSGGVLLTIPGAQIIGYISAIVPKFPSNQTKIPPPINCTIQPADHHGQRRKRSIADNIHNSAPNLKELANSLFKETFTRLKTAKESVESVTKDEIETKESFEKLMQESDITKQQVEKFINKLSMKGNVNTTVLPVVQTTVNDQV